VFSSGLIIISPLLTTDVLLMSSLCPAYVQLMSKTEHQLEISSTKV